MLRCCVELIDGAVRVDEMLFDPLGCSIFYSHAMVLESISFSSKGKLF